MKAGILFMQCIKNYKSLLQSYSLKTMIEALGHEAGLVGMRKGDMSKSPLVSVGSLGKTRAGEGMANCRFKLREKILIGCAFDAFRNDVLGRGSKGNVVDSRFDAVLDIMPGHLAFSDEITLQLEIARKYLSRIFGVTA